MSFLIHANPSMLIKIFKIFIYFRNKKHHYREMPEQVKEVYGPLPNQFMQYWDQRYVRTALYTVQSTI